MKTAFKILSRDLAALLRNPLALVVVAALLVLPGLYAWYCIVANWDPYANTGNVPIAIVNHDKGANSELTGDLNVGESVIDKLRENDSLDWRFYDDEEKALEDTSRFVCYATIVLPENLSSDILGIFEGSKDPPTIYFYPNEKYNAVATKVSDSAVQTLIRELNQQFSSTVNETLLKKVQDVADQAEAKAGDAGDSALAEVKSIRKDIESIVGALDDAQSSIAGWRDAVAGSQGALSGTQDQLPIIRNALATGSENLTSLRNQTDEFSGVFAQSIIDSSSALSKLTGEANATLGTASADIATASGAINGVIAQLETISDNLFDTEETKAIHDRINSTLDKLYAASSNISSVVENASATMSRIDGGVKDVASRTRDASNTFTNSIMPAVSSGTTNLSSSLFQLSGAIGQFEPQVGELQGVLSQADSALERASGSIDEAKALLLEVSENLKGTATDLGSIGSALQIDRVAELLDIDPANLGQFMSSPVQMTTQEIFPVSNYGTAVAPFYTNLALWVGCFILASLIKLEVDRRGFEHASNTQRYFGRWLLFAILSLLQSQVICGVDILLGIDCAHPALFMLAGAVCSFAFMNLIYALVITFRNVGKTLCILLLIMQVPGSSGMYPIEMMPTFFQAIHPLLPFTYGINAMREALCGMYGVAYFQDLVIVLLLVPLSFALGLALRPLLLNVTQLFDAEMAKTGFFAGEEHGQGTNTKRLMSMMRTLASSDEHRDEIEERAWSFNRRYPKLQRAGTVAALGIPFAFLVFVLPFNMALNLDVNAKLTAFLAMLIALLLVFGALIVLEYAHHTITEETKLLGLAIIGDLALPDSEPERSISPGETDPLTQSISPEETDEDQTPPGKLISLGENYHEEEVSQSISPEEIDSGEEAEQTVSPGEIDSPEEPASPGETDFPRGNESRGESAPADTISPGENDTSHPTPKAATTGKRRKVGSVIRDIFLTDLRLGFQSVIGVVVIALLVITPPMYAWFNIAGSWDPYGKTDGLKVAVANMDKGYKGELVPITLNVGDTIVSQLRGNDSFDWIFTDESQTVSGVESGAYYAAIVISDDFSQDMMTYLTEDADYPDVTYYTNEKENPIAPIITQKGANSIQENIRTTFTQRVDEVGLSLAYDLVDYVTKPRVSGYALKMAGHIDDATHDMGKGATELKSLGSLVSTVSDIVEATDVALDGIAVAGDAAKKALGMAKEGISGASGAFSEAATLIEDLMSGSDNSLDNLAADVDAALEALQSRAQDVPTLLDTVAAEASEWLAILQDLRDTIAEDDPAAASELDPVINSLDKLVTSISQAAADAAQAPNSISQARADLSSLVSDAKNGIADARNFYNDNVKSAAQNLEGTMSELSSSARVIDEGVENAIAGLSESTEGLSSQLIALSEGLVKSGEKLSKTASKLQGTKQRLQEALESGELEQIENILLGSDLTFMSQRLAQPVNEQREAMYSVQNYGSSMAPFYTVLSLWVGALVMISTMHTHVASERIEELRRRYGRVLPRQEFFGRYAIFGFISLLQSFLVLLGDLLFLQIQCVNIVAFFAFGLLIGQVFCLIVYTLTEVFSDIGKALCVILLIMQVAASGGTFPVEMLDPVLLQIAPYLPFFHAMKLLQECVAGVNLSMAALSALVLLVTVGIMLIIGIVIRRPLRRVTDFFEAQLEKTGYM